MVQYSSASVFANDLIGPLAGIADLDMALFGDQWRLFAANEQTRTVSLFDVLEAGDPTDTGITPALQGGQFAPVAMDLVTTSGGTLVVFGGAGNALHSAYEMTVSGGFGDAVGLTPASGLSGALTAVSSALLEGLNLLVTAQSGQAGFSVHSVDAEMTLAAIQNVTVEHGAVADIELIAVNGAALAVAIDSAGNEVLSYSVAPDGTMTLADTLGVADGLGLISPQILRVVELAGQSFGVVAATSSSSISVFEIEATGALTARDHVIDGQGTRFAAISELEIVESNGRAFVLAAGTDDGVTLMELLPDGRLLHHATLADTEAVTLQNVSGLTGQVQDGVLHVFVASATETGLTELTFDLGNAGQVETGGAGNDTLTGGAGDDVLFGGHGGDDVLSGQEGDDILVAGVGADRLFGGAGADVFVFGSDHDGGQVDDFNVARDTLDLSGWFLLHDVEQLSFVANGDRVDIGFQGCSVTLFSHDGSPLRVQDVKDRITINPSHSLITDVPEGVDLDEDHHGTAGDDVLFGAAGADVFYASTGADTYIGGADFDIVTFENASDRIKTDLLFKGKNRGEIADDALHSIEGVKGTDFQDVLKGDHEANWFDGGAEDDVIKGRGGDDELTGGIGADRLEGGSGDDDLQGGTGDDQIKGGSGNDDLQGGDGDDILKGNKDDDDLRGDAGDDLLKGGGGHDRLAGGAGNDTLTGGNGADEFIFEAGSDRITDFSAAHDTLYIDAALLADPTMTASEILETYGVDTGRSVLLDFGLDGMGEAQVILLDGVGNLSALSDSLFTF